MQGTTLTINGGNGKDKYNFQNTSAGSTVNLVAGKHNDTVNISSSAESLQTIQGHPDAQRLRRHQHHCFQ